VSANIALPMFSLSSAMDQGIQGIMFSMEGTVLVGETTNVFQDTLTLPLISLGSTVLPGRTIDASNTLPILSMLADGGHTFSAALPLIEMTATVADGEQLSSALALPFISLEATGLHDQSAADLVMPLVNMNGLVLVGTKVAASMTLPLFAEVAAIANGAVATAALVLPLFEATGALAGEVTATIAISLPMLKLQAEGYSAFAETYRAYAMNTETDALTEYQAYGYNSFAKIGDSYYAASPSGIFELAGNTDNGAEISAAVTLKNDNFGDSRLARMAGAYLSADIADDLRFGVNVNGNTYQYEVPADGVRGLVSRRIDTVKGEKALYWQMAVSNVGGADFTISAIEPVIKKLGRRV
jgi:hypothetical protein